MLREGKIKTYNTERGFGFIQVDGEAKDLFFHIKDMPKAHVEPKVGEALKFMMVEHQGKLKADHIQRLDLSQTATTVAPSHIPRSSPKHQQKKSSGLIGLLMLVLIVVASVIGYWKYQQYQSDKQQRIGQLMSENQQVIAEQRAAQGDLPDTVFTEQGKANLAPAQPVEKSVVMHNQPMVNQYRCDGREHCSQMRSYEEALFFLKNCPNTKMDGDNDGIPCESQFGRH